MSAPAWLDLLKLFTIQLIPVRPQHAAYIYSLRINPTLNAHLSAAPDSPESQAAWIAKYMEREKAGKEYYFLITRLDGTPCGTVRLYDFRSDSFCWGSWILDANKTRFAAIESALLVYQIGFDYLRFPQSHFDVRRENTRVINFHIRLGSEVTSLDDQNVYMKLTREKFQAGREALLSIVAKGLNLRSASDTD